MFFYSIEKDLLMFICFVTYVFNQNWVSMNFWFNHLFLVEYILHVMSTRQLWWSWSNPDSNLFWTHPFILINYNIFKDATYIEKLWLKWCINLADFLLNYFREKLWITLFLFWKDLSRSLLGETIYLLSLVLSHFSVLLHLVLALPLVRQYFTKLITNGFILYLYIIFTYFTYFCVIFSIIV